MPRYKIQVQEKARRKRERVKMRGLPTPAGTYPRAAVVTERPWFVKMARPIDTAEVLKRLNFRISSIFRRRQKPPRVLKIGGK